MMRNWFENTLAILTISALAGLAIAQQQQRVATKTPVNVPANAKFSIQIDPERHQADEAGLDAV